MKKYDILVTNRFKRDVKTMIKRNLDIQQLDEVVEILASGESLDSRYRDHELKGDWIGYRECHISPDWLLIYRIEDKLLILTLTRTGSHSDLF